MHTSPTRLLIVENDTNFIDTLRNVLKNENYDIITASCGIEALKIIPQIQPSLVLLDVCLPDIEVCNLCREIRRISVIPIILLTTISAHDTNIVGLEAKTDDYLIKPFHNQELITRIRNVLQRETQFIRCSEKREYQCADLLIDFIRQRVMRDKERLYLSATEYRLLTCLALRPGEIVSAKDIITEVWGNNTAIDLDLLRVNICRLRGKLKNNRKQTKYILTVSGYGYLFKRAV
jgi:DNA-binding response OmpR family regulator